MNSLTKRSAVVLATAIALPFAGGCVWTPELSNIQKDIARQLPGVTFDHEMSLSIGPGGMALARAVVSFIPNDRDVRGWLRDVSRVEVSVYEVHADQLAREIQTPARIKEMIDEGWEMAARVREKNESVWVLYRVDGDSVREMFVVSLDREELVLVKVKGRLERVIGRALSEMDEHHRLGRPYRPGT